MAEYKFKYEISYKHQDGSICLFKHAFIEELDKDWIIIHTEHNGDIKLNKQDLEYILKDNEYYFKNNEYEEGSIFDLKGSQTALIFSDINKNVSIDIVIPNIENMPMNALLATAIMIEIQNDGSKIRKLVFNKMKEILDEMKK